MNADVTVRMASALDVLPVVAIERGSFSDPWSPISFTGSLNDGTTYFTVAEAAGQGIVGFLIAIFVADQGEVGNIAVSSECRGKGIGARLLDDAIREGGSRGIKKMFLEVRESNEAAKKLYFSRGFQMMAVRRKYYRSPVEDALVLALEMEQG